MADICVSIILSALAEPKSVEEVKEIFNVLEIASNYHDKQIDRSNGEFEKANREELHAMQESTRQAVKVCRKLLEDEEREYKVTLLLHTAVENLLKTSKPRYKEEIYVYKQLISCF